MKPGWVAVALAAVGTACGAAPENVTELPPISAIDSPYALPSSVASATAKAPVVAAPSTSARPRAP